MSATTPAILMTQLMAPKTMLSTLVTQLFVAQFVVKVTSLSLVLRAIRIVFSMTLASITIARPIKAWVRVFLPAASLPGSPAASIYK